MFSFSFAELLEELREERLICGYVVEEPMVDTLDLDNGRFSCHSTNVVQCVIHWANGIICPNKERHGHAIYLGHIDERRLFLYWPIFLKLIETIDEPVLHPVLL